MSISVSDAFHQADSTGKEQANVSADAKTSTGASSEARLLHLHSYFLFPFAIDKGAIMQTHPQCWRDRSDWITGLDEWIASQTEQSRPPLGGWWRAAYDRFDLDSAAYQDMVFFHPFVRRVFFDSRNIGNGAGGRQALMRCYAMSLNPTQPLTWNIADARVLDYLENAGLSQNTIVIYTSDQGFFLGDHGFYDKRLMYEERFACRS